MYSVDEIEALFPGIEIQAVIRGVSGHNILNTLNRTFYMPERQDSLLIADILSNIENIFEFTDGWDYVQFISSKIKVYAVIRCFEIMGEAASLISEEIKISHPLVEWREMKNFRKRLR